MSQRGLSGGPAVDPLNLSTAPTAGNNFFGRSPDVPHVAPVSSGSCATARVRPSPWNGSTPWAALPRSPPPTRGRSTASPNPTPRIAPSSCSLPSMLLERAARLLPPPRIHRRRYHGLLAPHTSAGLSSSPASTRCSRSSSPLRGRDEDPRLPHRSPHGPGHPPPPEAAPPTPARRSRSGAAPGRTPPRSDARLRPR